MTVWCLRILRFKFYLTSPKACFISKDALGTLKVLIFTSLRLQPCRMVTLKIECSLHSEKLKSERDVGKMSGCGITEINVTFDHCLHNNKCTYRVNMYHTWNCILRTGVLHKPLHNYWATLNHTCISHHHGYNPH